MSCREAACNAVASTVAAHEGKLTLRSCCCVIAPNGPKDAGPRYNNRVAEKRNRAGQSSPAFQFDAGRRPAMHPSIHAKTKPEKPAYIMASTGETVSYKELDGRS